jgi:hypothetical protein
MDWKKWLRPWQRPGRIMTEPLRVPGLRWCPSEIRDRLHEIEPLVECVDVGNGYWMLGAIRWSRPACEAAQAAIARELTTDVSMERANRIEILQLTVRHGFRPITIYDCSEPDAGVVEDFRVRDWNYKHRPKATFEDRLRESDDEPGLRRRQAIVLDSLESQRRSISRYLQQSPKSRGRIKLNPGLPYPVH